MDNKKRDRGFEGEIARFAGDAAKQRALAFAKTHAGSRVITGEGFKAQGVSPCYVVLEYGSRVPDYAEIVTE